jgi:hypothetical protein
VDVRRILFIAGASYERVARPAGAHPEETMMTLVVAALIVAALLVCSCVMFLRRQRRARG